MSRHAAEPPPASDDPEAVARPQLLRLYMDQTCYDGPPPGATLSPAAQADAEGYLTAAQVATGCTAADLLAAGYALRRWMQRRSLAEQAAWPRAHASPHYLLIRGLAGAACTGSRAARDWYVLACSLRRVALTGTSRAPVINDYVIGWVEENLDYLS